MAFCTDMNGPGKDCKALNITFEELASCSLQGIPTKKIINGLIVELIRHQRLKKPLTKTLVKWTELLYRKNWPTNPPAELTLIKSLNVLHQKHRKVVLQKHTQVLNEFSCSTYCLPVPKVHVQPKLTQRPKVRKTKRQSLLHRQQLHAYEQTTKELAAELHATQDSFGIPKAKVKALEKKAGHTITRNIHKREKRKEATLLHRKCYLIR